MNEVIDETLLEELKLLIGISDELQDTLLKLIIKQSNQAILSRINRERKVKMDEVPAELDWVVLEVATKRFNRLNSEGMKSKTEEGTRLDWGSLIDEHLADLTPYMDDEKDKSKKGVMRIW